MSAFRTPARRLAGGLSAGLAAAALVALSAGPGAAATVVAQATATAFEISIAGQNATSAVSGTYAVKNDGKTQTSSGSNEPAVPIPGLGAASIGTLAQDATTRVVNRNGQSAACSGLAGDGATLVAVGDGACLEGGNNLQLSSGTLDLTKLSGAFSGGALPAQLQAALGPILGLLNNGAAQINPIIQQVLDALGNPSLTLDVGAIQSACTAMAPNTAEGDSQLTDVELNASIGDQDVTLLSLPTSAPPNTKIPTQANVLVASINTAIRTQLTEALNGAATPIAGLTDAIITQINDAIIAQIAPQLQPLQDNLLDGTINKQTRTPGAIEVTALDLQVLPAAQQFTGFSLASVAIGNVTCGPSGRVAPPTSGADPVPPGTPAVPTFVPAGEAGTAAPRTDDNGLNGVLAMSALGGLAVVSAGAGVAAYRKTSSR